MKLKGRPPTGRALSGAQRVARHRARQAVKEAELLREILNSVTIKENLNGK